MLVSINWLKQYIDLGSITPEELAEKITKAGIEVDQIHYVTSEKSENVVVGYVTACEKHPNADKLSLCQVDVGDEQLQIICGAPNVAKGQKVAVAKPGAVLPGNFKIKKVKLRGVESNGMICSLKELGVQEQFIHPDFKEGIVVLPEDAEVGQPVDDILNLDDVVLEFDLTPNRADALSMIGVAYEVAAILDKEVTLPKPQVETEKDDHVENYITVHSEAPDACPHYLAYVIKDVEIKPSPMWMQNYLLAAGIRPINNVVDITNYVLLEYGQPLHAFDYDLLNTKEIVVRYARDGEKIVTLDDQERSLKSEHLLITNGKEGVAIAGVMGGKNSEVNDSTKTVLLEAAYFYGGTVRKAVQHTGLRSEASTRFEKGVDPNRVKEAGLRACELLVKYANGKVVSGVSEFIVDEDDVFQTEVKREKVINMNAEEVNKRLGTAIDIETMENILRKLHFAFERNGNDFTVRIPTRRGDITIFEDMLEEVARIYGYDNIPFTLPQNASQPGGLTYGQQLKRRIKQYLHGVGLSEAITYSLTDKKHATMLMSPELSKDYKPIRLAMPLSEDHEYLRLSLLPELLNRLSYNVARKQTDVALYELGAVFLTEEETLTKQPKEHRRLAGAITGVWLNHPWQQDVKRVDFYVVKGIVEGLFRYLNIKETYEPAQIEGMHPGRCAMIKVDGEIIGFLGQIHPSLAKEKDLKDTYVFDLNFEWLEQYERQTLAYEPVPKYPSILRDIAFVVKEDVRAGDIKQEIEKLGVPLVKRVEAFDVYRGESIKADEKSIAFNVHFQDPEKTLTDEEVDELFEKIINGVNEKFNAYVRR